VSVLHHVVFQLCENLGSNDCPSYADTRIPYGNGQPRDGHPIPHPIPIRNTGAIGHPDPVTHDTDGKAGIGWHADRFLGQYYPAG
jgi:hypothetical protein